MNKGKLWGTIGHNHKTPEKIVSVFLITIKKKSSYLCAGNFSIILLCILCVFKLYVECLDWHIFLDDACNNIKVTKRETAPRV